MRKWNSSKPFKIVSLWVIIVYLNNVQVQSITRLWLGRPKVCIFPTLLNKKLDSG